MDLISFFIILQIILLFFMTFHDWVHLPPLTNIRELEKHSTKKGRLINSIIFFFLIFIPLMLTLLYRSNFPLWVLISVFNFYFWLTFGTILSWWIPYFFGSSQKHKDDFAEYENTHHFLLCCVSPSEVTTPSRSRRTSSSSIAIRIIYERRKSR